MDRNCGAIRGDSGTVAHVARDMPLGASGTRCGATLRDNPARTNAQAMDGQHQETETTRQQAQKLLAEGWWPDAFTVGALCRKGMGRPSASVAPALWQAMREVFDDGAQHVCKAPPKAKD